jgi:FeS assembly protein IscX
MGKNSQTPPLYWEATYEIVLSLMAVHPEVNLDTIGLAQIKQWVVDLPNFEDDPTLANDAILTDILREWYEETH